MAHFLVVARSDCLASLHVGRIPVRDINRESMERLAERIKSEQSKWKLPTPTKRKTKDTPWGPIANRDYVETKSPSLIDTFLQERG